MKASLLIITLLVACTADEPTEPIADASVSEIESASTWCAWRQHSESSYAPCGTCIKLDTFQAGQAYVWSTVNCFVCYSTIPGSNAVREVSRSCQLPIPGAVGCSRC